MKAMFKNIKLRTKIIIAVVFLIAVILPIILQNNRYYMDMFINLGIFVILGSSMNLLIGYSGQISMGMAAFYGIGAYTSTLLVMRLHVPFIISMIAAIVLCFLVGFVLGFPSTKLNFIFLGLATCGLNTIIYLVIKNSSFTGGTDGISGIPPLTLFGEKMSKLHYYFMTLLIVLIVLFVIFRIVNSKTGRALKAIKGNPIAASAMGINVNRHKLLIFAVVSSCAGLAGVLYAFNIRFIQAEAFSPTVSINILTMGIIGGMGDLGGGVIGSLVAGLIPEFLRDASKYQTTIYGLLIVLVLRFMPGGIVAPLHLLLDKIEELCRKLFIRNKNKLADGGKED